MHNVRHPSQNYKSLAVHAARSYRQVRSAVENCPVTTSSATPPTFICRRSELGDLLYRLKYNGDLKAADEIVATAATYLRPYRDKFTLIVPVPPSTPRKVQPVITIANGIGAAVGLPVVDCIKPTRATTQLKEVSDPERRNALLDGLFTVDAAVTRGQHILLFDDLYRSGATMNAITLVLLGLGQADSVNALTITRTRSNR